MKLGFCKTAIGIFQYKIEKKQDSEEEEDEDDEDFGMKKQVEEEDDDPIMREKDLTTFNFETKDYMR